MLKSCLPGLLALVALVSATPAAAQPAPAAEPYTFVAEWNVPRGNWGTFVTDFEKNTRPVLEKLAAGGTLVGWGVYENVVHTADGYSHGAWWTATSYANIEKARRELMAASAASTSLANATGHRDFYLRSIVDAGKSASGEGFLNVSSYVLKPGKGREWKELWERNNKAFYDEQVAKGTLVAYSIDVEDVHTESPLVRMVAMITPSAEADDAVAAAADAADAKLTSAERTTRTQMMEALLEPGTHRDMYARIIRHWRK